MDFRTVQPMPQRKKESRPGNLAASHVGPLVKGRPARPACPLFNFPRFYLSSACDSVESSHYHSQYSRLPRGNGVNLVAATVERRR
jgi:hypothetical protein